MVMMVVAVIVTVVMIVVPVIVVAVVVIVMTVVVVIVVAVTVVVVGMTMYFRIVVVRIACGGVFPFPDRQFDPVDRFDVGAGVVPMRGDESDRSPFGRGEGAAGPFVNKNAVFQRFMEGDAGGEFSIFGMEGDMVGLRERARFFQDRLDFDPSSFESGDKTTDILDLKFFGEMRQTIIRPFRFFPHRSLDFQNCLFVQSHDLLHYCKSPLKIKSLLRIMKAKNV